MAKSYSRELSKYVKGWLHDQKYNHKFYEEKGVFRLEFGVDCSVQRYTLIFKIHGEGIGSKSLIPIDVMESKRPAIAEFFTRVNHQIIDGNFEMDFSDGEVAFKMYMHTPNVPAEDRLLRTAIIHNSMWSEYGDAFLKVVFADVDPQTAITQIED